MKRSDELDQLLKNLHLKRILEIYDEQIGAAEKEDLSYSEFLTRLLRAQWHNRQETALLGALNAPTCRRTGRWPPSPSLVNPESAGNRSIPWPNWTSSPRQRTSC